MGMYDSFILEKNNQFELIPGEYQTKSLDCALHIFTIDKDNVVRGEVGSVGYDTEYLDNINQGTYSNDIKDNYNGALGLDIYGPCGCHDELYSKYYLVIKDSKVISITDYNEPYYNIETGVITNKGWGKNAVDRRKMYEIKKDIG